MATLGVPNKVGALEKSDLKSSKEKGNRDGDIMYRKVEAFLEEKDIPKEKKTLILDILKPTLTNENVNKITEGE